MATLTKILGAVASVYCPVTKIDGELFRFKIEQINSSRMYYSGKHRLFETKLKDIKIVEHWSELYDRINEGQVFLINPTIENSMSLQSKTTWLSERH